MNSTDWNTEPESGDEGIRLQVFLAHAGVSSRRGAEDVIAAGRVRVNGRIAKERGMRIGPKDEVIVDGRVIRLSQNKIYIALNKPSGYVCTNDDPEKRPLAKDLLGSYSDVRLFSVGRLDFLSEGLIFFTNDGDWSNAVSHPRSNVEKEYEIEARKEIPDDFLEEFMQGIHFDGERYKISAYKRKGPRVAVLTLVEGKNREIRNACAARRVTLKRLERIRIGCVKLGNLQPGAYRTLGEHEVSWFIEHQGGGGRRGRRD